MTPIEMLDIIRRGLCSNRELAEEAIQACCEIFSDYAEEEVLKQPLSIQGAWAIGELEHEQNKSQRNN